MIRNIAAIRLVENCQFAFFYQFLLKMKQSRESFFLCSYEKKQLRLPRFYEKEMDALFESAQGATA